MKGLKESFRLIYSNTPLRTRETLPLSQKFYETVSFSSQTIKLGSIEVPTYVLYIYDEKYIFYETSHKCGAKKYLYLSHMKYQRWALANFFQVC